MHQAFIGIDVGTSSARAGVFDENGTLLATARHPITLWHEAGGVVEQSSSEIWSACAASVRAAMGEAAIPPSAVKGLGFDATCSLVVLDAGAHPLTVSSSGDDRRNVIVWMDHRAMTEAREVNETQDEVLRYVGGSISPEMEIPKLLWLKRHLPSTYRSAGAESQVSRSTCTVVLLTSWEPRPASWRRRQNPASFRVSGVLTIREWCPGSGSTRADSPPPVRPSITSSGRIPLITKPSRP